LDASFIGTAFIQLLKLLFHEKYDVVITVVPSFQFGLLGCFYKLFRNTKTVYHIQDMQIEAAEDFSMIKSKTIIKLLYKIERFIFKNTDVVSSISEEMVSKISKKAKKDVV